MERGDLGEISPVNLTIGECRNGWKVLPHLPLTKNDHAQEAN